MTRTATTTDRVLSVGSFMSAIVRQGCHESPADLLPGSQSGCLDLLDRYRAGSWTPAELGPAVGETPVPVDVHVGVRPPAATVVGTSPTPDAWDRPVG